MVKVKYMNIKYMNHESHNFGQGCYNPESTKAHTQAAGLSQMSALCISLAKPGRVAQTDLVSGQCCQM